MESQFNLNRIVKDSTKYDYVVSMLGGKYLEEVEDIVENPLETDRYEALREASKKRLTDSDATRVRKLLETEEMGDRTPSQYWRHFN